MFDVIADVHAHYAELTALLLEMGYAYDPVRKSFTPPPGRQAVFIGDYIDKGVENFRVVQRARQMVEAGAAQAILGNHDVNAVHWTMPDPNKPGAYLRTHTPDHFRQHREFLAEAALDPQAYAETIAWFKTLPLYLKVDDCHFIHACWHEATVKLLEDAGCLTADGLLTDKGWLAAADRASPYYDLIGNLLCGPEEKLGPGFSFLDSTGIERTVGRVAWWRDNARTYGEAYASLPLNVTFAQAAYHQREGAAAAIRRDLRAMPPQSKIFTGHIGQGLPIGLLSDKVCCVDYNVGHGGPLVAYRLGDVAQPLNARDFVSVANMNGPSHP